MNPSRYSLLLSLLFLSPITPTKTIERSDGEEKYSEYRGSNGGQDQQDVQ